jgi:hypothetical protein
MPGPKGTPPPASCENQRQQCLYTILALVQRDELSSREVLQAIAAALSSSLSSSGTHPVCITWGDAIVSSPQNFLCDHPASFAILTGNTPLGSLATLPSCRFQKSSALVYCVGEHAENRLKSYGELKGQQGRFA